MVKNIEIIDVGSENNEAPKEVEEIKEEPIINEESKEVEPNNIINEEKNKENIPPDNKVEEERECCALLREPKQELKSKTYSTEKVECPKCKKYLTKYTFKYRHNCNGIPVKKEPDPNKVVRRKIMHPEQANEFKNDVYEKVKKDIPKVDEQEIEKRVQEEVEERVKKHLETTANKVFETAKDRYINMKVERDNKNKQKINNLASKII